MKPQIHDRVLGIPNDVVLLARLNDQHLTRVQRFASPVDLDLTLSLQDAKDLAVIVDVLTLGVGTPAGGYYGAR